MKWSIPAVVAVFLAVISIYYRSSEFTKNEKSEFFRKIELAKHQTADPCGRHNIKLVHPPAGLNEKSVLVIGGRVVYEGEIEDVSLEAREPEPGEHTVRVAITPAAPEFQEIIWIADGTKACQAGLGEDIKRYATSGGRAGGDSHPRWPASQK